MAATNESAPEGLDLAGAGQGTPDWTLDESSLEFDPDILFADAAADALFPDTLPGEAFWLLRPADTLPNTPDSPQTPDSSQPSGLGGTFSAVNASPWSPATEYSFHTQHPSPGEAVWPAIASPGVWTGSASLFGPLELPFQEQVAHPQPIHDYLTGVNSQAPSASPQPLSLDPLFPLGGALSSIPSNISATTGVYPYGSPLMASPIPGVFPVDHSRHSDAGVCTCPHRRAAPVDPAASISPSIPIPPSPSGGSHSNNTGASSGCPPRIPARERRKIERPEKCPVPGCAWGVQYSRDLREHIRVNHKDVAHVYGVSTAKHPCEHPGCPKLFARRDHMTRHWRKKHAGPPGGRGGMVVHRRRRA